MLRAIEESWVPAVDKLKNRMLKCFSGHVSCDLLHVVVYER